MRVTMATRVEVSPLASLTPVPNLKEITKEDKLQTTYYHPVGKTSASPPLMVLAGPRNLGTPSRALPMPRLSPKPFSKENSSPITSVKPSTMMTRPLTYSKLEDSSAAKSLDENMPSLVEPKMDDGGGLSSNVIKPCNKSSPQTIHSQNTIILFETTGPVKSKVEPSLGKRTSEEHRVPQLQGQSPSPKTETMTKPALPPRKPVGILQRQASLSSDERPVVLRSWEKGEEKEPLASPSIQSEGGHPPSEAQLRGRRRPVSAIFIESLQHPKPNPSETPGGKVPPPPPEKSWVRKPRPLSMDLTAKFENKDILSKKVGSPLETSKDKGLDVGSSDRGNGKERSEPLEKTTPSKPTLRLKEQGLDVPDLKNKAKEQNPKIVIKSMEACSPETSTDSGEASVRKGWTNPLEEKTTQERDPDPKEAEGSVSLLRSERSPGLAEEQNGAAKGTRRDSLGGGEWVSRGNVKKRVSLFGSESFSSRLSPEAPSSAPEKEKGSVKVQDRIKEWTVESPEVPPENRRRSFQSRPLSADLTKVFTRPALESESRLDKGPAPSGDLQENNLQEKNREEHIMVRTDLNGASTGKNQWKPVKSCEKSRQIERKLSSGIETDVSLFPKEDSTVAPRRLEEQSPPTRTEDDGDFQTVWATVFEHNVMRYATADHPFSTSSNESVRKCGESPSLGTEKASWLGKGLGDKGNVRTDNSKWAEKPNAEKPWNRVLPDGEKSPVNTALFEKHTGGERWNVSSLKQMGSSLSHQRIEPRYDIVQMTSERILSEAVVTVPEEKAMTLRTSNHRSSLKEKKDSWSEGLNVKQQGRLDMKMGSSQASGLIGQAQERLETATPKSEFHEPKDMLGGSSLAPTKIVEKPYLVNHDKASGTAGNEKASRLFSHQNAKEKESPTHVPETVMVRAAQIDSYHVRPSIISAETNKFDSPSPVERRSELHDYLHRAVAKEESFDLRSRKHLGSRSMRKESLVTGEGSEWSQSQAPEPEAKVRKSGSVDLRLPDRWRRKTLPYDAKFDECISFAPEPAKSLGRQADSLSSDDAYFKKSRKTQDGSDLRESSRGVLQDAKEAVPKPESPREPRETYFAVTYQIPGNKREYNTDNSVYENRKSSSLDKDELTVGVHSSPKFNFLSESSPNSRLAPSHPRDSSENFDRKNRQGREREQENLSFPKSPKSNEQPVLSGERRMRHSEGRVIDVDALWVSQRSGNAGIPSDSKEDGGKRSSRTSEHYLYSSKNSDLPTRRKQSDAHESPRAKTEDGYRSSILDIDALMAEYKEESMKGGEPRDRKEERVPVSHGGFQRERSSSKSSADYLSQRYDWRGQKEPQDHGDLRKSANLSGQQCPRLEEPSPMIHSPSEISKEKTESPTHEPSRQRTPSTKFAPPLWSPPHSGLSEQYLDSLSDPWKKMPAEDEKKGSNKPQNPKCRSYRVETNTALVHIKNTEASLSPKTSPVAPDAFLFENEIWAPRNSVGKREKVGSLHGRTKVRRGDCDSEFGNGSVDIKRTYSEKTAPASIRENLSLMQEARERRTELKTQKSLPGEKRESTVVHRAFPHWEMKSSEDHKVPQDVEKERVRTANNKSPFRALNTTTPVPRRSHSFSKDKKMEPLMDQLKQCFARQPPEAKDTDTLVQENDSQYGTWNDPRQSGESFAPESPSSESNVSSARKQPPSSRLSSLSSQTEPASPAEPGDSSRDQRSTSLDRSSTDLDSTDGAEGGAAPSDAGPEGKVDDFSFIHQTSVLDSSALKARAQLSKRNRRRAPISHSVRRSRISENEDPSSLAEETDSAWMFKDSTEEKSVKKEESDEEEKPSRLERTLVSQPQRLPIFPGVDPSVLKAQLRKRNELDSSGEGQASAQLSKSPKSPFQPGVLGSRVLPSSVEKDDRSEEASPQWLKDLKSKKRLSQYENQA